MKKKLLFILICLLLTTNLFADKAFLKSESQGLPIYAYLRTFCELNINEYAADSTDTVGMPFSITNSNVKYNS
ncbi:MAG: hypothetical protein HUK24_09290 [Sphaerochaetaceae bacterium]|nr:hypothetical protein [Sphaerochaetaceae bacterium]